MRSSWPLYVLGGLISGPVDLEVCVAAVRLPLLTLNEGAYAPKLADHRVLRGGRLGVARKGVGVNIIHISNVQIISSTSGVCVHETIGSKLFRQGNNGCHIKWLGLEHPPAVALVERLELHDGRMVATACNHGLEIFYKVRDSLV